MVVVFAQPTLVRRRLSDHQQRRGSPDPAGRNPLLTTIGIPCSRFSDISSLVLLNDEFSGSVEFKKLFLDSSQLAAGTYMAIQVMFYSVCHLFIFSCDWQQSALQISNRIKKK